MEQHPVPRHISGFQFRLVGDMTLRQFLYLAAGGVSGYIILKLPLGSFFKFPLAFFSFFSGVAFAFIPIQERPLDIWVKSFIKSVFSPTQFIWKKEENIPEFFTRYFAAPAKTKAGVAHLNQFHESKKKLKEYLATLPQKPSQALDQGEINRLRKTLSLFGPEVAIPEPSLQPITATAPVPPPTPSEPPPVHFQPKKIKKQETTKEQKPQETSKEKEKFVQVQEETLGLSKKVEDLKKELGQEKVSKGRFLELQEKLSETLKEQERLTGELAKLRKTLEAKRAMVVHPRPVEIEETPRVKMVSPKFASRIGLPKVPTVANLVSGVIKTTEGEFLPSMIVTILVKDEKETPVRALKTNRLGQFAASTPLAAGTYTLEIVDPQRRYKFDIIGINLVGEVFPPLEITAKSKKELEREKLVNELFKNKW